MKIRKREILFAFLFIAWVPAHILYGWVSNGTQIMLVVRFLVSLLVLIHFWGGTISLKGKTCIAMYIVTVAISTFLGRGFDVNSLFKMVEYVSFIWAVLVFTQQLDGRDWFSFIKSARLVGIIYLAGSIISNIIFLSTTPELGYQGTYFFLGSRAESVQTEVLLLVIMVANNVFCSGSDKELYVEMGACLLDAILFKSGQGITMIGLLIIAWILFHRGKTKIIMMFSPLVMAIIIGGLNYIVLSGLYQTIGAAVYYITEVLGKSLSLTGRTIIFETAVQLIAKRPLWGYGYNNTIISDTIGYLNSAYVSAHNSILDIILNTGLLSFVFLCLYVVQISKGLYKMSIVKDKMALTFYLAIFVYFVGGLVNLAVASRYFWVVLALASGYIRLNSRYDMKGSQNGLLENCKNKSMYFNRKSW